MSYALIGGSKRTYRPRLIVNGRGLAGCNISQIGGDGACPDGSYDYDDASYGGLLDGGGDDSGGGGSAGWAKWFQDLSKEGLNIVKQIVAPTLQRDAAGNLVYRTPTTANQTRSMLGGSGSPMPGWVWVAGGVGLVAIIAMSSQKKRS